MLYKIKFFINILLGLLFFIPFLSINLFIRTKFLSLKSHRLGHFVEDYFLFNQIYDTKSLNLLSFYSNDGNKYLKKIIKKNNVVIPSFIGSNIYLFLTTFNKKLKFLDTFIAYEKIHKKSNYQYISKKNQTKDLFKINSIENSFCLNFLKKHNPENKKIITVNITSMEHLDKFKKNNWSHHNVRKSDIKKYKEFFKYLIKKNYLIIRLGYSKLPLKFNDDYFDKNFINYSTFYNDDTLDFYLMSKSYIYISSGSGLDNLAFALNVPMIINTPIIYHFFTENNNTIYLLKKFYCEKNKKYLKADEIFRRLLFKTKTEAFEKEKIQVINNTTEELINAFKDIKFLLDNNYKITKEIEVFNENIWNKYIKHNKTETKNYFENNKINSLFSWSNNQIL